MRKGVKNRSFFKASKKENVKLAKRYKKHSTKNIHLSTGKTKEKRPKRNKETTNMDGINCRQVITPPSFRTVKGLKYPY